LFSFIVFHICSARKENPEAGRTSFLSPARPPGEMEWMNRCLSRATCKIHHEKHHFRV